LSFDPDFLTHVPKKLLDSFDSDMLQLFDSERFLFDQVNLSDQEALLRMILNKLPLFA